MYQSMESSLTEPHERWYRMTMRKLSPHFLPDWGFMLRRFPLFEQYSGAFAHNFDFVAGAIDDC
jgi:hypothetical protein